jgi:hypothetical protein
MDRRLKEVRQTDLTEGRVNQDFVDWLKTSGPTYLLIVLVAVCAYLAVVRYRQHRAGTLDQAWADLVNTQHPESLKDIAAEHESLRGVPQLARLQAAEQYLLAIESDTPIDADPAATPKPVVTAEQRDFYLREAEMLFDAVAADDDQSVGMTLHVVRGMAGKAAIAEMRGEMAQAKSLYEKAAARAERDYPTLAERLRKFAASAEGLSAATTLPAVTDLTKITATPATQPAKAARTPVTVLETLQEYVLPDDAMSFR